MSAAAIMREHLMRLYRAHLADGMIPTSNRFLVYELIQEGVIDASPITNATLLIESASPNDRFAPYGDRELPRYDGVRIGTLDVPEPHFIRYIFI
jgi:hypothetical protein